MNTEIFIDIFKYYIIQNPLYWLNDLYNSSLTRNEKVVEHNNNAFIDLRNAVNRKEIHENENPDKVIDIVEEILNFNNQKKGKRLPLVLGSIAKVFDRISLKYQVLNKFFKVNQEKHLKAY